MVLISAICFKMPVFDQDISNWDIANEANVEYADHDSPIHNTNKTPFPAAKACDTQPEITRNELMTMINNRDDVTNVCTRAITDFHHYLYIKLNSIKI